MDIAAGWQSEDGATVVEQIEFDVTSASDQLLLAVISVPRRLKIAPDKFGIDFQECAANILREGEVGIPVAAVMPVVKNAADAARFLALRKIEILFDPCLGFC